MTEWMLVGAAVLAGALVLAHVRRMERRLERLFELYREIRHEYGQLNARVTRLEDVDVSAPSGQSARSPAAFVPLSSLRR